MKFILKINDKVRGLFEKDGKLEKVAPIFEAADTFAFTPETVTDGGSHIRDSIDIKRVMMTVIYAVLPCFLFGIWNAGQHYNFASGLPTDLVNNIIRGSIIVLPIVFVSYAIGGFWEVLFACVRKHEINEGLLVTGLLFPLILPPTIPLWQVALGVSFGVVIGKEVFGGTGMNIVNPALLSRAFLFFAYAKWMGGDVWVASAADSTVDAVSGATPLSIIANLPTDATIALDKLDFTAMFLGNIPGSIGETSALACLIGAVILLVTGVASWRIMLYSVIGMVITALLFNQFGASPMAQLPPHYHLVSGGFAFGIIFMATDPVSGSATNIGKCIYGFLIGFLVVIVRVLNSGFPEGVMLSILFMNLMAPLIDTFVVDAHIKRRAKRA